MKFYHYKQAADHVKLSEEGKSYKNALYSNKQSPGIVKKIHFLAVNAVKKKSNLDKIIDSTELAKIVNEDSRWLANILLVELLWGRKQNLMYCKNVPLVNRILELEELLRKLQSEVSEPQDHVQEIPKYIRIEPACETLANVLLLLERNGFNKVQCPTNYIQFIDVVKNLNPMEYVVDFNIPNLLVFHPRVKFPDDEAFSTDRLIRQDKASCLVAPLLSPLPGSTVLDMCAAPGYKTQHLASIISRHGMIYAVDRDLNRFKTLQTTVEKFGMTNCTQLFHRSNTELSDEECPNVEYILLDPPCSGTGIANALIQHTADAERLRKLHSVQVVMLKTALNKFPCTRRILYSTCSVTEEENEAVIDEALSLAKDNGFSLVPLTSVYGGCFAPGKPGYNCSDRVIRLSPSRDLTNGFFIALFERSVPPKCPQRGIPLAPEEVVSEPKVESDQDDNLSEEDSNAEEEIAVKLSPREKQEAEENVEMEETINSEEEPDSEVDILSEEKNEEPPKLMKNRNNLKTITSELFNKESQSASKGLSQKMKKNGIGKREIKRLGKGPPRGKKPTQKFLKNSKLFGSKSMRA